jgi:hypothetical protein
MTSYESVETWSPSSPPKQIAEHMAMDYDGKIRRRLFEIGR